MIERRKCINNRGKNPPRRGYYLNEHFTQYAYGRNIITCAVARVFLVRGEPGY